MTVFQIVSALFALFMMYIVTIHRKKKNLSKVEASAWLSVWSMFIIIALFPDLLLGITNLLKFSRVFDLLIVIAFMIQSLLVFLSYFRVKSLEKKLENLVRKNALSTKKK